MFEVSGTHFERGVFEIYLEKSEKAPLKWIFKLGPVTARFVGLGILTFSFLFSTSSAPTRMLVEGGYFQSPEVAFKFQQSIGYGLFFVAVIFYMTVFLFRKEKMALTFNKTSRLYSVIRTPMFFFTTVVRGHSTFQDIEKVEKLPASPEAPHGRIVIRSSKMPKGLKDVEFRVLSDEQYESFPLNIERVLGQ